MWGIYRLAQLTAKAKIYKDACERLVAGGADIKLHPDASWSFPVTHVAVG